MEVFKSTEDELIYWKSKALGFKADLDALRREYEEYQEESKSLENELEVELKQSDVKCKDLNSCVIKLKNENDHLRNRLETQTQTESRQHSELSTELSAVKTQVDELRTYIRQLEQKNDDLERSYRAALGSIEDFESKLNGAIERNVILESELDEKEGLKAVIQRMRDETRDLRSELNVKAQDSNRTSSSTTDVQLQIPPPRPSRISPLSIVNDLLRKVGALETKLATYHRKEEPSKRHKRTGDLIKT